MSINDPNFWAAMLGGGIIGAAISAITTIFFGPRWVERSRMRRFHSEKIENDALKPWLAKFDDYSKVSGEYSIEGNLFVPYSPKDPEDLPLFLAAKSHLRSGYSEILESWEQLKEATFNHNHRVAEFLNDVGKLFVESTKLPNYNRKMYGKAPEEFIVSENLANSIYEFLSYENVTGRDYFSRKPHIEDLVEGDKHFCVLRPHENLAARSLDKLKIKSIQELFISVLNSNEKKESMKQIMEEEQKNLPIKRKDFEGKLTELIRSIELGNNLRGKCKDCP